MNSYWILWEAHPKCISPTDTHQMPTYTEKKKLRFIIITEPQTLAFREIYSFSLFEILELMIQLCYTQITLNAFLHIWFVCVDIVHHCLWCHPPQWHLVLEGGHVLWSVSGETKVWYLEQLPLIHQDVAAGQVTVEDTQGGEVLLKGSIGRVWKSTRHKLPNCTTHSYNSAAFLIMQTMLLAYMYALHVAIS